MCLFAATGIAPAQTLLLEDNFNAADTANFDGAPLTGRLSGSLAGVVQLRSARIQQDIAGMQLSMLKPGSGSGRIRFHRQADLGVWYDWASGAAGAEILSTGGFRVEFDWTAADDTSGDWISFCAGIDGQGVAEPGIRVNAGGTDYGILFRNSGATQRFDNGPTLGEGGSFATKVGTPYQVVIEFQFSSWADGSSLTAISSVDGTEVANDAVMTWDNNGGAIFLELGSLAAGTLIDNFRVTTREPVMVVDTDNDDLPDDWELANAGNLTDLNGLASGPGPGEGTGDFDGDGCTDLEEFGAETNPTNPDTDGDGLSDGDEKTIGSDPNNPDTDGDELNDADEVAEGTSPVDPDSDDDGSRDAWEIANGSDPLDANDFPAPVGAGVSVVRLSSEALSGVSDSKTYTHAISGGGAATINGVVFEELAPTVTPSNFAWDAFTFGKNEINPINNGDWNPGIGGVSGSGLLDLLGGFSYSGGGANPGSMQRYTLSGLTPGIDYVFRLYTRVWDTEGSGRPIDVTFTNGGEVVQPFGALPADRPGTVLGVPNPHAAYYLEYAYTAQGTELVVDANVHPSAAANSGSLHMYGLSNEVGGDDTDSDGLPDSYEIAAAGDLATLDGDGVADADGDGLSDLDEFTRGTDPLLDDSDGDGLTDGEEAAGAGARPPTDPLNADTDGDGLSDLVESNTGTIMDAGDSGSNPTEPDTDGDGVADGIEVTNGSDPNDSANFLPARFTAVKLTDDASSGIDSGKTYTHAISGGNAVTVNEVNFEALTGAVTPANFDWNTNAGARNALTGNDGEWNPGAVGLGGSELAALLQGFTYSDGAVGSVQTYTLSGLTLGQSYQLRLYIRIWSNGTVRPLAPVITNGPAVFNPMMSIPEDRPGAVLANGDNQCAYYLAYDYVAQGTELVLDMTVPPGGNGSFHMYGMSNEVVDDDDFDGDGTDDLLEIAYGFNPESPDNPGPLAISGGAITNHGLPITAIENVPNGVDFTVLYPRREDYAALGLTTGVQFSHDMMEWFPGDPGSVVVTTDGIQAVEVEYPFFLPNGRKARFWQVVVTAN